MSQFTTAEDALGSITLAGRFIRGNDATASDDQSDIPIKYLSIEYGNTYSVDTVYAKVLPNGMIDSPSNYVIIPVPTNGFPVPLTLIRKVDFTYAGTDAIIADAYTLMWRQ